MAFRKFKEIGEVLTTFDIVYESTEFVQLGQVQLPQTLADEMKYTIKHLPYKISEAAIGEMIIFPILKEVWRKYDSKLTLWSHKSISFGKDLSGIPDYMIATQSKHGMVVLDKPLLAVVEAKKDDFVGGWAQCALEMYTIQQINTNPQLPVFGIVSNGDTWEIARLIDKKFIVNTNPFHLASLDELYASLDFILNECINSISLHK